MQVGDTNFSPGADPPPDSGRVADAACQVSVLICTRNRSAYLRPTFAALAGLEIPRGLSWELVVVDNNSSDLTAAVVPQLAREFGLPLRLLSEPGRGKCLALNRAMSAARGDIVAFIDDDILPEPQWLRSFCDEFAADPALDAILGRAELADPLDLPICLLTDPNRVRIQTYDDVESHVFGGNCVFRRRALAAVGGFDPAFGPGSPAPAADDRDYLYRGLSAGLHMLYAPSVLVYHKHGRRTQDAGEAIETNYGIADGAFFAKYLWRGDRFMARMFFWKLQYLAGRTVRKPFRRYTWRRNSWMLRGFTIYTWMRLTGRARAAPPQLQL